MLNVELIVPLGSLRFEMCLGALEERLLELPLVVCQIRFAFPEKSTILPHRLLVFFFAKVDVQLNQALNHVPIYFFIISFPLDQDLKRVLDYTVQFFNDVLLEFTLAFLS